MRTLKTAMIVLALALFAGIAGAQQQGAPTVNVDPELVLEQSEQAEELLRQIEQYYPAKTEAEKKEFRDRADKLYTGKNRIADLTALRNSLRPETSASAPTTATATTADASADQPIASDALVGHEKEYHNPPCGNDAPFNEVTKDGKLIPRCFSAISSEVTVIGKAPKEPAPAKVHVPDPPKTEDPARVHVQDGTTDLEYKMLVEEEMRGLIDASKKPAAVSARNELMRQAAHKEALERYVSENCGRFRRGKNEFECARMKAELRSIVGANRLAGYNQRGYLTGCEGTPAQIVNGHVVEPLHVDGVSMGVFVYNDTDLVWDITSPSRIHTNRPAGPIAVALCPHSSITLQFVLTSLFGPGSGYTSSRRSSNERRQDILLIANSKPLPDGEVLHDEYRFTLDTNDYDNNQSRSWYIGQRTRSSVSFLPKEEDGGSVESQPRTASPQSGTTRRRRSGGLLGK